MLLRNFFYAVGLMTLFVLHGLRPAEAQFGDLVMAVQNPDAILLVLVLTILLVAIDGSFGTFSTVKLGASEHSRRDSDGGRKEFARNLDLDEKS